MSELKLKQLRHESDSWKRLLCFMRDENAHLKYRLSEILRDRIDKGNLDEIEVFQSRFINKDEMISLLRNEVAELDKYLVNDIFEDPQLMNRVNLQLTRLRYNTEEVEKQFRQLKSEFNNFLFASIVTV